MYSDSLLKLPIFTIQKNHKILLTVYSLSLSVIFPFQFALSNHSLSYFLLACFCNQHPLALLLQGFFCIFINRIVLIYLDFFRFPVKIVKDFFPYLDGTYTLFFHEIIADNYKKNRRPFKIFHFINKPLYKTIYPAHF